MKLRGPSYVLVAIVIIGILVLTLSPAGETRISFGLCVVCGERGLANIIGNLLLFLPFGALLTKAGVRPVAVVLLAALLSTGIEITQLWVPGRNPNPADTLFNTLGAAAGVAPVRTSGWWLHARGARQWRLGAGALSAVLGTILGTGWLQGPAYPDATYYGQWTPEQEWLPSHPGQLLVARLGSMHIPSTRLEDGVGVRESLQAGEPLTLHAVVGPPIAETWPIFRIAAGRGPLVVTVARQWDELFIRFRTRAAALRLTPPEIHASGVFAGVPADHPVWIRVWRSSKSYCIEVDGHRSCGHGFTVGRAWALLHGPGPLPRPLWTVLDAGILAALLLPVGYWWRRWPEILLGAALVTAALVLTPVFTVLRPTPPVEIAGAFFGLVAGAVLGRAGSDAGRGLATHATGHAQYAQPNSEPHQDRKL